jgi:hypothetical protein
MTFDELLKVLTITDIQPINLIQTLRKTYEAGWNQGHDVGSKMAYEDGYNVGNDDGYNTGLQRGYRLGGEE